MKSTILLTTVLLCTLQSLSQQQVTLNENNAKVKVNTNGILFHDANSNSAGYEIPVNSNLHIFNASSFWFGGTDVNGQVKFCGQKSINDKDYWTGPLSTFGGSQNGYIGYGDAEITPSQITTWNQVWSMTQAEIQNHIQNWNSSGYTPPSSILDWPAHGDISLGQDYYIAPFVDVNGDGIYKPTIDGDYPYIRGDEATFLILNDKGGVHSSTGEPIGLELHLMVYQYNTNDCINNTTFVNARVINRSTQTLYDFKMANYTDPNIGNPNDDFVGCHPAKNLLYGYNSDNNDDGGYGTNPPAAGVISLNHPMAYAGYFDNQLPHAQLPNNVMDYLGFMNGFWGNSVVHFTQGGNGLNGTTLTNFIYDDINNWSEYTEGNTPGDRQMFMSLEDPNGVLTPGEAVCYDFAYIYSRDGNDHLDNVNSLFTVADSVQAFYANQNYLNCDHSLVLGLHNTPNQANFSVYPNPAQHYFTIGLEGQFDAELFNITGQKIMEVKGITAQNQINVDNYPTGVYAIKIQQDTNTYFKKLIIK